MRRIITMILSSLIVIEMTLTGLGFCGHFHTHGQYGSDGHYYDEAVHEPHQTDHDHHPHETDKNGCECGETQECSPHSHCPCLGGFIGEFQVHFLVITLNSEWFRPLKSDSYSYAWARMIFHPPQTI